MFLGLLVDRRTFLWGVEEEVEVGRRSDRQWSESVIVVLGVDGGQRAKDELHVERHRNVQLRVDDQREV